MVITVDLKQAVHAQKIEVIKADQLYKIIEKCEADFCVYNFWATWCAPCIREIPEFEKLSKSNSNVKVRLISLDDVDEVSTKLDLAKAYLDMGDADGTRSILDEVMTEGDDTQKREAEELLRQIG